MTPYNVLKRNINSAKINIDINKYKETIKELSSILEDSSISEEERTYINSDLIDLKDSFEYYIKISTLRDTEFRKKRNIYIDTLLEDLLQPLIKYRLMIEQRNFKTYEIDLSNRLDLLIAESFKSPITEVRENLINLAEKKGISYDLLCHIILNPNTYVEDNITIEDIVNISDNIKLWLKDLCNKSLKGLSLIDSAIDNHEEISKNIKNENDISMAFSLRLTYGYRNIIQRIIQDLYNTWLCNQNGLILSEHKTGVIFRCNIPDVIKSDIKIARVDEYSQVSEEHFHIREAMNCLSKRSA